MEGKAIPVTDHGGPQGWETSRFHIFQRIRLQMVVRLQALRIGRLTFTPRDIPGTHFC
jgi:hypothetical protein